MKKQPILELTEDLLEEAKSHQISKPHKSKQESFSKNQKQAISPSSIEGLMIDVSKVLGLSIQELRDWIEEAAPSQRVAKAILMTAKRLKLNPLLDEITWEHNLEGGDEVYVSIDGWIAMIHRESSFQGLVFNQSNETENGVPIWMDCTIHRSNLTHPISVREYYAELKTDHPMWQLMPRRMLRHKTLQQCARLAFGISVSEFNPKKTAIASMEKRVPPQTSPWIDCKELLKEKLRS